MYQANLGFKAKLILTVVVTTALSLIAINFMSYQQIREQIQQRIVAEISNAITMHVSELEEEVNRTIDTVTSLANEYITPQDNTIAHEKMMLLAHTLGGVDKVLIGFDDGSSFTSRPSDSFPDGIGIKSLFDPTTRPWYSEAKRSTGLAFSDVFFTKSDQIPMMGITYNINNGVIMGDIRFDDIQQKLIELSTIKEATGLVIDDKGLVVASTIPSIEPTTNIKQSELSQHLKVLSVSPFDVIPAHISGEDILVMSVPIQMGNQLTWQLIVGLNENVAFSELIYVKFKALLTTIASLIVMICVVALALHKIYQPIVELKKLVKGLTIGSGNLTQRLEVKGHGDLADIAVGINQFIRAC